MKTLKQILELYKPKSQDEDKFVKKHIVVKHRDKNGNGDPVFQATNIKALDRKKERHGYEPGEDEEVYEEYEDDIEDLEEVSQDLAFRASIAAGEAARKAKAAGNIELATKKAEQARKFVAYGSPRNQTGGLKVYRGKPEDYGMDTPGLQDRIKATRARQEITFARLRKAGIKEEIELDEVDTNAATQLHTRLKDQHNKAVNDYDTQSDTMTPQQKKAEQQKISKLHDRVQRAKSYIREEEVEYIEEKLKVSDGIGAWISDFVHSDNPKFEGFSKRKRMKMAQAAFYSAQRGD